MNSRRISTVLVAAIAAAAPITLALPAEASTSPGYCTVTPKAPRVVGTYNNGQKIVRYEASITCKASSAARKVTLAQEAYEEDNGKPGDTGGNDLIKAYTHTAISVGTAGGTYTKAIDWTVSTLDGADDRWIEVFHRDRLTVSAGGVTQTSVWVKSPVSNIFV